MKCPPLWVFIAAGLFLGWIIPLPTDQPVTQIVYVQKCAP